MSLIWCLQLITGRLPLICVYLCCSVSPHNKVPKWRGQYRLLSTPLSRPNWSTHSRGKRPLSLCPTLAVSGDQGDMWSPTSLWIDVTTWPPITPAHSYQPNTSRGQNHLFTSCLSRKFVFLLVSSRKLVYPSFSRCLHYKLCRAYGEKPPKNPPT